MTGKILNDWSTVVKEAWRDQKIPELIAVVTEEYGEDERFNKWAEA